MSAKQWMIENQINEKAYYYWQRKFRKEAYEQMNNPPALPTVQESTEVSFTELRIPATIKSFTHNIPESIKPTAVINTERLTIALSNDIADSLLSRLLMEVSHA